MSNRTSRFLFPYSRKATDPCSSDNTTCASLPNHSIIISKKENGLLQMMLSENSHVLRKQQCTSLPETVTFAKEQTSFFDRFARNAAIRSSEWWHIQEKEEHRLCLSYQQRYTTLTSQRRSHLQKSRLPSLTDLPETPPPCSHRDGCIYKKGCSLSGSVLSTTIYNLDITKTIAYTKGQDTARTVCSSPFMGI